MTADGRAPQNQRMLAQSEIVLVILSRKRLYRVLQHSVAVFDGEGFPGSAVKRGA